MAPQLQDQGNGVYTLTTSSVNFGNIIQQEEVTYEASPRSKDFEFKYLQAKPAVEKASDVAVSIAGRQKTLDDAIVVGDLYKIGSALAVCVDRNPNTALFESQADFFPADGGQNVEAIFQTIRPGQASTVSLEDLRLDANAETQPSAPRTTATSGPHVYRIAIGNVSTSRPCRAVEIGIRSSLGIRIANLCNFSEAKTYEEINADACLSKEGEKVKKGTTLKVDIYQSGTITSSEERYSFFRISYREAGTGDPFTEFPQCYGVRSITQQSVYNAIHFRMPDIRQWEFRFEPLSGWEIRSEVAGGALKLLDSKLTNTEVVTFNGVQIRFRGKALSRNRQTFQLPTTRRIDQQSDIGIGFTDEASYVDMW
ncbi:MAG: hypothetical protein EB075_15045, partial [Bacteroidetes bacterium]|nr:hypothetical protein [Bacteroidota bacterium]